MKTKLIVVGKTKTPYVKTGEEDFLNRLRRFGQVETIILKGEVILPIFKEKMSNGTSNFHFIIGGCLGLSKEILQRANLVLSLSRMTFPHELVRVILLEQIYRALTILKEEKYHK